MEEESDEELMVRIARGEQTAFHRLTRRHAGRALGLARRFTGNWADAEEITQEAWLRVWINAPRWQPNAAFQTWLYRIVINLSLNRRRRAPFLALEVAGDPADPAPGAEARLESDETDRLVRNAINRLADRQRAAILLTYREGLSNAETAAILDTTISGVETLLVRAKRRLRKMLDDRDDPREQDR